MKRIELSRYCFRWKFLPAFKFDQVKFLLSAMTLRKGSWSNEWYVRKGLDKCVLTADQFDHNQRLWKDYIQWCPHWITCKNWTLTHKIQKVGHSDLVLGVIGRGHLRCLETRNELCSSFHVNFWHPANRQTPDRQTDGRTEGRRTTRDHITSAELRSSWGKYLKLLKPVITIHLYSLTDCVLFIATLTTATSWYQEMN